MKPDQEGYSFERYFLFNVRTGRIEPNPWGTTSEEQDAARRTIDWFGWNDYNRPEHRRAVFQDDYQPEPTKELDHLPYRFLMALVSSETEPRA